MKKRIFSLLFILVIFFVSACSKKANDKDIVILYTTDVHCQIEPLDNNKTIGYTGIKAYKNEMIEQNNYVTLLDAGDFIQGDFVGAVSKGEYIIDIMNEVGYDAITLGDHEFDYGISHLQSLLNKLDAESLSCNLEYIGKNENKLNMVKPYMIKKFGNINIGIVGVSTPSTIVTSTPTYFMEDGEISYIFNHQEEDYFYSNVQKNIDSCKKDGADYVFLLSHLGYDRYVNYTSYDLVKRTTGVTAVMDGHQHIDLKWVNVENKDGVSVPICDAGYKMNEFGKITIKKDGKLEYEFIDDYNEKDSNINDFISNINTKTNELANKVIANSDIELKIADEEGIRLVRSRETQIGNLVADAYRNITGADIACVNGGGIRANLKQGDITFKDIMSVHPFGNVACVVKATGSQILDYLEMASMITLKDYKKDGIAIGESGAFANVSGLKYTIDTSIPSPVVLDSNKIFEKIEGQRRVKDVLVLENGSYVPLDANKTYKLASHNYLLKSGGDGLNMFVNDEEIPFSEKYDYEIVVDYIVNTLKGKLKDKYSNVEGRITIL